MGRRYSWQNTEQRGVNDPDNKAKFKLRFGIIDYPEIETLGLDDDDKQTAIFNAVEDGWWPTDNFARMEKYAVYLNNQTLVKYQADDLIMRAIIKRIKSEHDTDFGWSSHNDGQAVRLRDEIQEAILEDRKWIENLYLVDYARGAKKIQDNTDALLAKAEKEKGSYEFGQFRNHVVHHLPIGHPLAEIFLRNLQATASRYEKNDLEDVVIKLSKQLIEKEWGRLTDLVRAFLINREDLDEDNRLTAFRCMLRERTNLKLQSKLPWDFIRKLQPDLLPIIPQWLKGNMENMTGNPVTSEEFKKLSFRVILKGTNGAKRRTECDPKASIEAYDKLFISDAPAEQAYSFLEEVNNVAFKDIKRWMIDCGTETAKELAVFIMTERLTQMENKDQMALEARIKAEPKELLSYKTEDKDDEN